MGDGEWRFFCIFVNKDLKNCDMARPIRETPILTGKDAARFIELMNTPRPETEERKAQIRASYETVMKMLDRNQK